MKNGMMVRIGISTHSFFFLSSKVKGDKEMVIYRSLIWNEIIIKFFLIFIKQYTKMFECFTRVCYPLHRFINVRMKNGRWIQEPFRLSIHPQGRRKKMEIKRKTAK